MARRARGVRPKQPLETHFADDVAALAEGRLLAHYGLDGAKRSPRDGHQLMTNPMKMLAQNIDRRVGQEMVDVGNAAMKGILDRDKSKIHRAFAHGGEGVLERRRSNRLAMGQRLKRGEMRKGAGLALENHAARLLYQRHLGHAGNLLMKTIFLPVPNPPECRRRAAPRQCERLRCACPLPARAIAPIFRVAQAPRAAMRRSAPRRSV